jgi:glycosyltransferase involved in cell wall biosynthesis
MVSVVIPAYNATRFIKHTLDSVLAQTYTDYEIIVVDDGSADNTGEIVKSYGNKVRYVYQANAGTTAARNTGIKVAKGEWIAFLDHDDEWLPEKLATQAEFLKKYPQLVWITGNYYRCVCDTGQMATDYAVEKLEMLQAHKGYFESYFDAFLAGAWGHTDTMLIKKTVLEEAGLFRVGQIWAEDLDTWFRIAYRQPQIGYVSRPIAVHHRTQDTLLRRRKSVDAFSDVISRNLALSAQSGQLQEFRPCAVLLLQGVIRGMFFEKDRRDDIRALLRQFGDLLPAVYKAFMQLLTAFPRATRNACLLISATVRLLHIRRKLDARSLENE